MEFVSKVEQKKQAEELNLKPTPGFGPYKGFFPRDAIKHPAKANTNLIEYLVKKYTEKNDTVLDPMAGTGSTGIIAAIHGRDAILVELEDKFVKLINEAKKTLMNTPTLKTKGNITVLRGDARRLSEILKDHNITTIISSPPYGKANTGGGIAKNGYKGKYGVDKNMHLRHDRPLSNDPENISNLPQDEYYREMLTVFIEMYKVLNDSGMVIILIRPFINKKSVVDLPNHTLLLLQIAGFKLDAVFKLRLVQQSFWRILYSKKYPEIPTINHEYIIVCKKSRGGV